MNSTRDELTRQPGRSGRRPGDSGTRAAIADAAGRLFAENGYDRTSLRAVARAAGVDPALVGHFFGSKQQLFLTVVELPFDPAAVLPPLLEGNRSGVGMRLARFVVEMLESQEGRKRITGIVRAAASEPEAARLVRELVTERIFTPLTEALGVPDAALRAGLVGSQVIGMTMARYVIAVEPLASTEPDVIVAALAPTLQRYLTEPLG